MESKHRTPNAQRRTSNRRRPAFVRQLQNAVRNKTETTIKFSPADLNGLIARDPGFSGLFGKARVNMLGQDMIVDLSASLDSVPLPRLKGRWFNGTAQFGFAYDVGQFSFVARSIESNGHRMVDTGAPGFSSSFLQSFSVVHPTFQSIVPQRSGKEPARSRLLESNQNIVD